MIQYFPSNSPVFKTSLIRVKLEIYFKFNRVDSGFNWLNLVYIGLLLGLYDIQMQWQYENIKKSQVWVQDTMYIRVLVVGMYRNTMYIECWSLAFNGPFYKKGKFNKFHKIFLMEWNSEYHSFNNAHTCKLVTPEVNSFSIHGWHKIVIMILYTCI